ncbi:MAG: MBL fold metallo-hydrolase [Clostridia bacterium]|nr:MBL fold metallo-hydrolase [Clostridia bacterium]
MQNYKICCLYSGSGGNSAYIEAGGAKILIDAGKNAKHLCLALCKIGVDVENIDAIFVTHDHSDHTAALRTLAHKHQIPIYMLLSSAEIYRGLMDEKLCGCLNLFMGYEFETSVRGLRVKAFPTPHDSLGSVGFRLTFEGEGRKDISIGYATDIGHVTEAITQNLWGCESVILESNHDTDMLWRGPYPIELKERIASPRGHLSNRECATLARLLCENGTKNLMLAHLSRDNNTPALALAETQSALSGLCVNIKVADPGEPTWLCGEEA